MSHLALLSLFLIETVSNGSGSGLVDDTENVETRNDSSVLGGLSLSIVEVGRDSDDGVLDGFAQEGFGNLLHLVQNHGRDLLRRVHLLLSLDQNLNTENQEKRK